MGAWGSEVFENDTASDYVLRIAEHLSTAIERDLATIDDGILEREFGAAIGILRLLVESVEAVKATISKSAVQRWRVLIDDWFQRVIKAEQRDHKYWSEYRDKIVAELDRIDIATDANWQE